MSLFEDFCEIFFEKRMQHTSEICVKSLLWKYKEELWEVFFDDIYTAVAYQDIKFDLEQYKFFSNRQYMSKFVDIYVDILKFVELRHDDFVISTVPMHWTRYISRWFDHMKYIAKNFSKKEKIAYKNLLSTKFTFHQATLSRIKRFENRKNIFSVKNMKKIPKNVILLDDIVTSGITVNECARVLKASWVQKVVIFALANNS